MGKRNWSFMCHCEGIVCRSGKPLTRTAAATSLEVFEPLPPVLCVVVCCHSKQRSQTEKSQTHIPLCIVYGLQFWMFTRKVNRHCVGGGSENCELRDPVSGATQRSLHYPLQQSNVWVTFTHRKAQEYLWLCPTQSLYYWHSLCMQGMLSRNVLRYQGVHTLRQHAKRRKCTFATLWTLWSNSQPSQGFLIQGQSRSSWRLSADTQPSLEGCVSDTISYIVPPESKRLSSALKSLNSKGLRWLAQEFETLQIRWFNKLTISNYIHTAKSSLS